MPPCHPSCHRVIITSLPPAMGQDINRFMRALRPPLSVRRSGGGLSSHCAALCVAWGLEVLLKLGSPPWQLRLGREHLRCFGCGKQKILSFPQQ